MTLLDSDADMQTRIREALAARFDREVAEAASLDKMGGHASLRIYWRIHLPTGGEAPDWEFARVRGESTLVAMVLAPETEPGDSDEGPDREVTETDELPFVDVQRYLAGLDIPVPAVEHVDDEAGVLLLEDLGDRTFEDQCHEITGARDIAESARRSELESMYRQALDLVVDLQQSVETSRQTEGDAVGTECLCWRRKFDRETLLWELDHYTEWGLEERVGADDVDAVRGELDEQFDALVDELLEVDRTVVLRDFQSSNLMYRESEDRQSPWVVIDFQDALVGPFVYDVVALLRDSYVELAPDLVSSLLSYYVDSCQEAGLDWSDDPSEVRRAFHLQTVQRKLKDAGRFIFIDREKNNPDFLDYYQPSLRYVDHALAQLPGFDELRDVLHRVETAM
jgi:aminoglycoside/choline kinase family phosphotransferase